jgi:hypothetical protein
MATNRAAALDALRKLHAADVAAVKSFAQRAFPYRVKPSQKTLESLPFTLERVDAPTEKPAVFVQAEFVDER